MRFIIGPVAVWRVIGPQSGVAIAGATRQGGRTTAVEPMRPESMVSQDLDMENGVRGQTVVWRIKLSLSTKLAPPR
jgi:hypothetical protein